MLKGKPTTPKDGGSDEREFKENPEINAKIDARIKSHPKEWDYIQAMSPERRARALVLQAVQKHERQERIKEAISEKLDKNPEMKKSLQAMVKDLPVEQQGDAVIELARKTQRIIARKQEAAKSSIRV